MTPFRMILAISLIIISSAAHAQDRQPPVYSDGQKQEILFKAAREGNVDILDALVKLNTNIDAKSERGFTALILSAYHGHKEATEFLLKKGADSCAVGPRGNTALMGAVFKGQTAIINTLTGPAACKVDFQNPNGQTALMLAALFGRTDIANQLLEAGANPDLADSAGNSPRTLAQSQDNKNIVALFARAQ